MSTRVVDIEKPYEGGTAIEVTQDKVINLRLRSENNLIIYDEGDNEIYVDLQLPSDIEPADAIPVGINTGRVLAADGWDYTGTIVVFKTTSGDNIKLLYADNGRVFIDNGTGTFKEIYLKGDVDALILGLRNYINDELAKKQDKLTAGANITIAEDPQTHELVISSTGGGGASYTAGTGIDIDANDVISVDPTYMGGYIPRSNASNPDYPADNALYYGEYGNQGDITALGLHTDQIAVRATESNHNTHNAYLEYYNNAVDLFLSDTVSGTTTRGEYKSNGIESTIVGGTTETFEFQGTGNNKIARLSDLAGKQDVLTAGDNITIEEVSVFDTQGPAPSGFHVPLITEWQTLCDILTTTFGLAGNDITMGTYLKMPKAGLRSLDTADVSSVSTYGYYWSSSASDADKAYRVAFNRYNLYTQYGDAYSNGLSVRCFKNTPVIPDYSATSTWRQLYIGTGGAGIYWDDVTGLISISSDGINWITIADKNLGATTVYNRGDIVTDANCGYFYQWGNNYGFPHSGNVTTSSTQVDASNYGPGNYYNSSTFIYLSRNWSSVQNDNLWGGVTKGLQGYNHIISAEDTTYKAGYGINIFLDEISVDNTVALKSDLSVVSGDSNTYSIVVSNSAPASGTPNTTLTFVV